MPRKEQSEQGTTTVIGTSGQDLTEILKPCIVDIRFRNEASFSNGTFFNAFR